VFSSSTAFTRRQALRGGDAADAVDYGLTRQKRPTALVVGDVAEHPVLDLVPLAGARKEVAHPRCDAVLVNRAG
jgi:hypothetical protein